MSIEQRPNTESGFNRELLDLAEQIEKGVKWNRIPMQEASQLLQELNNKYPEKAEPLVTSETEEKPLDELDSLIGVMEQIEDGVKSDRIPTDEAISVLQKLNDKYPVEKGEQS